MMDDMSKVMWTRRDMERARAEPTPQRGDRTDAIAQHRAAEAYWRADAKRAGEAGAPDAARECAARARYHRETAEGMEIASPQ